MEILDAVEHLLKIDNDYGLEGNQSFKYLLETKECFNYLEDIQKSGNQSIVERVEEIISNYLPDDDLQ